MSRRKSDKEQPRLIAALLVLLVVTSGLASYLGYRAIKISLLAIETLDTYNEVMREIVKKRTLGDF